MLLSEAFGRANFTFDIPNTIHTKFRMGSLTKAFTCTAKCVKVHKNTK
ncbi:beta-lactamase family protein [Bacillus gaemokensis]|nr:beta-lactamase family protein [Bacillus gaemokensis]